MKLIVVALRDRAADCFGMPQFVPSVGAGIRGFGDAINRTSDPNNMMAKHPEDFDLYRLGEYDDSIGALIPDERPSMIAIGKDLVISSDN